MPEPTASRSSDAPAPLAWGVLGAARIADKALIPAILATGGRVVAIGARSLDRAREVADRHGIEAAYEGYQPVVDHPHVEAVYIPLANGLHFHWALACARAGKHCLCEKPLVLRAHEARELREAFAQAQCRLMEAFMWRHHPQVERVLHWLRAGEIGELRRIHAEFSFTLDRTDDYRWQADQGGGALWDVGCYCVNAMRLFFESEPLRGAAVRHAAAPGSPVDRSTAGWLDFGADRLGTFACSFTSAYGQSATIVGTRGTIRMLRPFLGAGRPARVELTIGDRCVEESYEPADNYAAMVRHFTRAARDGCFALQPGEDGAAQAAVMEALAYSADLDGRPQAIASFA